MAALTLSRYFAYRFLVAVVGVFVGVFVLVALVDYIDLMRKAADVPNAPTGLIILMSLYRVPQIMERLFPFSVLIGAMACYLSLARRMELVIARAAGMSVWQIITPALVVALLLGAFATLVYNPVSAALLEGSKRIESRIFGQGESALHGYSSGYWVRQRGTDGELILNAVQSHDQGLRLTTIVAFTFNSSGEFKERIEAESAELQRGGWLLRQARVFALNAPPQEFDTYILPTRLTREQVAESFAAPDTVGFWHLPTYIRFAEDFRLRRGRLSTAVPASHRAAVPAGGDDPPRRLGQLARLPVRRRAATSPARHRGRLFDLRAVKGDRRPEQSRSADTGPRGLAANRRRWPLWLPGAAVGGGRLMRSR